ncbi:AAA family ATPase [Actinophytocola xanthii]|uniref:ATP-binding protein n=1 Tax=Actinophytocola xanthii TaxID=1912961 RepID=A0A1Q8CRU1_9PSEU|nr:AAA family ATPase [Actinophytocola xanthii]OLF17075.1 ATP-binding protein [Actinophytocola xanthii]
MLTTLAVENYRSLRDLVLPLARLTLVTGANGSGKSSLYRALRLLADTSRNGAVAALAREGGLQSTLWAGPQYQPKGGGPVQGTVRRNPVALRLGFGGDDFGYALDLGLPVPGSTQFNLDPEFKRECLWRGPVLRPSALLADRHAGVVRARAESGAWSSDQHRIRLTDSMLGEFAWPEVLLLRERIRSWRFYDQFRTDADAPARAMRIGTRTPMLAADGADLPAALQTIRETGDASGLDEAVADAFPGARVEVVNHDTRFGLRLHQPGLLRPLDAAELSDGTLRYLLLVAALLTTRPPELLVLNEPETSLHPDLLPPLAALVAAAARRTQVVVVTHAQPLVRAVEAVEPDAHTVELVKTESRTTVAGQGQLDRPSWHWPKR